MQYLAYPVFSLLPLFHRGKCCTLQKSSECLIAAGELCYNCITVTVICQDTGVCADFLLMSRQ